MRRILDFCLVSLWIWGVSGQMGDFLRDSMVMQREALARMSDFLGPVETSAETSGSYRRQDQTAVTFSNPAAAQYYVDGRTIPNVTFDAGPSWSGLMPISANPKESRKLFFWFWPTNNVSNARDLIFWTNGGPGCSSLEGFLQENGPISWSWGQAAPTPNPWAWTNLSNVVYVEQPVGTGFSQGTPDISNDDELAAEVFGFMEQFLEVFDELKGSNFYVTGESYAGYYVPYIANYIYEHPTLDINLKGIWIADPSLSYGVVQQEIPALRFVQNNQNLFPFNSTFMAQLQNISDACGYTDYLENYVTYPPNGTLPLPPATNGTFTVTPECRLHSPIQRAVTLINPAFDVYRVSDTWPVPWSVLGFPRSTQEFIYFNRTDVQDAIHAPHMTWTDCSTESVYINATTGRPGSDTSIPSTLSVLPDVIEKSERVVIAHGLADFILVAEGTRIAIQNMTWGGAQGFQTPIEPETFTVKDLGVYGNTHTERGLTYVEFYYSGHMTPQFVPWAVYQTVAYLLGKQPSPSL